MVRLSCLVAALGLAACSFPTDGVPIGGDIDGGGGDDEADTGVPDANPPDACVPTTETCEGSDEDCDGMIDEGFTSGAACDGPDDDECMDDVTVCDENGAEVCGDTSGDDDAELCNSADDDCDGAMDEGFAVGAQCDGTDGDACTEGTNSCAGDGLGVVCSDATDTIVETCDTEDDDCDLQIDETFDLTSDTSNCGMCGRTCTNSLGTTSCVTSTCAPVCSNGAANCDANVINGCELQDTNPACPPSDETDASVRGDQGSDDVVLTGTTEQRLRLRITESNGAPTTTLRARLQLASGAGTDYDLEVLCAGAEPDCDGAALPIADDLTVGRTDVTGVDRTFDVFVLVKYDPTAPSTTCAQWTLTISGNTGTLPAGTPCGG